MDAGEQYPPPALAPIVVAGIRCGGEAMYAAASPILTATRSCNRMVNAFELTGMRESHTSTVVVVVTKLVILQS